MKRVNGQPRDTIMHQVMLDLRMMPMVRNKGWRSYCVRLGWSQLSSQQCVWRVLCICWQKTSILAVAEEYLQRVKSSSPDPCPRKTSRLEVGKRLGRLTARAADPNCLGDIPYSTMFCSAIKIQGVEEEGGTFMLKVFVFTSKSQAC